MADVVHSAVRIAAIGALLILAQALVGFAKPAMAAGRWVAENQAPTLSQQGFRYALGPLLPSRDTPLAGTAIMRVSWRYDYRGWRPRALAVQLCGGGRCIDASRPHGQTMAFSGLPVATAFRFYFRIDGPPAARTPLAGDRLSLMVNFE